MLARINGTVRSLRSPARRNHGIKGTKQTNNKQSCDSPPPVRRVLFLAWGSKRERVHYEEVFTQMGYESEIESD